MQGWEENAPCILEYLRLFQSLADKQPEAAGIWEELLEREQSAPETAALAPRLLRERLELDMQEFLLAMAALCLEMDGALRGKFQSRYGLSLPTVEYGLELIAPLCPAGADTLAALCGRSTLMGLLLAASGQACCPMERPLILCRAAAAFLSGLSLPEVSGVSVMLPEKEQSWLPLHQEELAQVTDWYGSGGEHTLRLQGTAGCGRRTLLRRACGGAVCLDLEDLEELQRPDREQILREAVLISRLLFLPVCALCAGGQGAGELERFRRRFPFPLAVLTEEEGPLRGGGEIVRLSGRLTPEERELAWFAFVPHAAPDSMPGGAMTIGAVRETARLAQRAAAREDRAAVERRDMQLALRRRGGALEFGVRYDVRAGLGDMVLSEEVLAQLREICAAARCGPQLAAWGLAGVREGVTAVFHGPSGTGKTMAAAAIAGELSMPLLRADLSQIMDKYVGETEKHLGRLMRCARENRCVLLFDEADALFGKRASVSTGHDKFANLSTSFLLQEMEQYDGVALLSTNLLSSFDDAFLRRLNYVIRFRIPDTSLREQLWRRALPRERLEGEIPFAGLACAELSPARINAAARAAVIAAVEAGRDRVDGAGLVRALSLELEKSGKALPRELAGRQPGGQGNIPIQRKKTV